MKEDCEEKKREAGKEEMEDSNKNREDETDRKKIYGYE